MSSDDLRRALGGPEYIGPVSGTKQEYQVFRTARGDYAVFSKSNRSSMSFHMTLISARWVEELNRLIPREGTTSGTLIRQTEVTAVFGSEQRDELYFELLTTLYVLAALGRVDIGKSGRSLVFTPR